MRKHPESGKEEKCERKEFARGIKRVIKAGREDEVQERKECREEKRASHRASVASERSLSVSAMSQEAHQWSHFSAGSVC